MFIFTCIFIFEINAFKLDVLSFCKGNENILILKGFRHCPYTFAIYQNCSRFRSMGPRGENSFKSRGRG